MPGGRRGEQCRAAVEGRASGGAERGEPGGVGGPVGGGLLPAGQHDGGDGGIEIRTDQVPVLVHVSAHGGVPFGDERTAVQQFRGPEQRGDVGLHDVRAGGRQAGDRGVEGLAPAVGHAVQVLRGRDGDPGARGRRRELGAGAGERVGRVGALDDLGGGAGEPQVAGEDGDAVEGVAGGDHAGHRHQALGGLDPDDAVEGGGHPPGAGRVGAQREVGDAEGDRDGRTGGRPAGDAGGVPGVAYGAVGTAGADQAGGELVQVGLAEDDRAGRAQPRHRGRVGRGPVGVRRGARARGQAGDVDVVLDGRDQAGQRQRRIDPGGLGEHLVAGSEVDPDLGPARAADAVVGGLDACGRRHGAHARTAARTWPGATC